MFCPNCASPIDAAQKYCPNCGTPAPVVAVSQPIVPGQPMPGPPMPGPPSIAATGRPKNVRLAGNLLFAAIVLNLLGTLYAITSIGRARFATFSFVPSILILVIWIFLILQMLEGKNWARIGVVLGIAWAALVALTTLRVLRYGMRIDTLGFAWVSLAMRICAGYLLFRPDSSAWFR
jgi:hypothetical protein